MLTTPAQALAVHQGSSVVCDASSIEESSIPSDHLKILLNSFVEADNSEEKYARRGWIRLCAEDHRNCTAVLDYQASEGLSCSDHEMGQSDSFLQVVGYENYMKAR
jgi:hypothetical protein